MAELTMTTFLPIDGVMQAAWSPFCKVQHHEQGRCCQRLPPWRGSQDRLVRVRVKCRCCPTLC